jgi:hypothetical protein
MIHTKVTLTSKIFDIPAFRQALSAVPYKSAKVFQESTKQKMLNQTPGGKLYRKRTGRGFKRFHKASALGQRPQPDTLTLVNAVDGRRIGEFAAIVDIKNRLNPENKVDARDYAGYLVNYHGREIMPTGDIQNAQIRQDEEVNKVIRRFV